MPPKIPQKRVNAVTNQKPEVPSDQKEIASSEPDTSENFPVIGIGASAGGLEAVTKLLRQIPPESGVAFVLVQHLDPSQPSRLTELLSRDSPIPVQDVTAAAHIQADRMYVIPPGMSMVLEGRNLLLQAQPDHPGLLHSIDIFFSSLARSVKERAVAIILSGTGNDGTEGARAIKEGEGLVMVQEPASAKYDGMPRAAIAAGVADYVLPPEAMIDQLLFYVRKSLTQRGEIRDSIAKDDDCLKSILSLVRTRTGRDFSGYKISSISRRIERRMTVNKIDQCKDYLHFLNERPAEIDELLKDFLINVTSFFRDSEAFTALKNEICALCQTKPEGSAMRAWIPGCSTGEEAYSIAMLIFECAQEINRYFDVQVFGTDLSTDNIAFARSGIYPATIAQEVDPQRLERFFVKLGTTYQVKKDLREKLIFAVHDLVTDPPYSHMDIVSVRNLLIYFGLDLQKRVIPILHYALNEGGRLFLGTAETVGQVSGYFAVVDGRWRIYRAVNKTRAGNLPFYADKEVLQKASSTELEPESSRQRTDLLNRPLEQMLLEALPPLVLINRNNQVIYTHGNTHKYLQLPEGSPSTSILDLAKPELKAALSTALNEALQTGKETSGEAPTDVGRGHRQSVKIRILPLNQADGNTVISFQDVSPRTRKRGDLPGSGSPNAELEHELVVTRETLRRSVEELETANEELRSSNEEYTSTNEELKSANEELETSREELRSVNEELTTINAEREKKIEELIAVSDDMRNLLNNTGIATVFLDHKMHIRRFTPAAVGLFKFIESDIGRPLEDIASNFKPDGLPQAARLVLDTLIPSEREVQTLDGFWYLMKIHPYRTTDNTIEGVVASFTDINRAKSALAFSQGIISTVREPLLVLNEKLKVLSASRAFYKTFRVAPENTEGHYIYELGKGEWNLPQLRKLLETILKRDKVFEGFKVESEFPEIGHRIMLLNARRMVGLAGSTLNILLAMEDVTGRFGQESFNVGKGTATEGTGE